MPPCNYSAVGNGAVSTLVVPVKFIEPETVYVPARVWFAVAAVSTLVETAVAICVATSSRINALDGMLAMAGAIAKVNPSVNKNVCFNLPSCLVGCY